MKEALDLMMISTFVCILICGIMLGLVIPIDENNYNKQDNKELNFIRKNRFKLDNLFGALTIFFIVLFVLLSMFWLLFEWEIIKI